MEISRRELTALAAAAGLAPKASAAESKMTPRKLKILILGGTGFIGPHQVRYALARGHQVTVFNRGREKQAWPGPVEELVGDRNTGDVKALAGRDWDVCIDNPTTLPFWVRDAAKVLTGHIGQYIFISTISVYADNSKPAGEDAALTPYVGKDAMAETAASLSSDKTNLYGALKAVSEAEAQRRFPGVSTIIRPGLIVGPGDQTDRFTYWPVRMARGGEVLAPGDGSDPVQFIDARDLAEWTIRMAEQRTFGVFNATGPAQELSMKAMLESMRTAVGSQADLTWVPSAWLDQHNVASWSDLPVWVPAQGETAGFSRTPIARALAAGLSFRPRALTTTDTLAWFRTQPPDRQAKLRAGLTADREAALLATWKASRGA